MAMDVKNSERLLSSILDSARAEADAILAQGKERAEAIQAEAQAEAARIAQEAEAKAMAARTDVLERSRTNAGLDARKAALAQRRAVVDAAFEEALGAMCQLDEAARKDLLKKLLLENAEGGECISPAQGDAASLAQLLPAVNQTLAQGGTAPLTMGDPRPGIQGGFFLVGASYELNCSFEALLRDLRETEVSKVADLLFG